MEHEVTCSVCSEQYVSDTHEPVALPCGHTFCRNCLVRLQTNEGVACPVCRTLHNTNPRQLSCIFSLLHLSEELKKDMALLPDMCHYHHERLKGWCRRCQVAGCGACLADHREATHDVVPVSVFEADKSKVLEEKRNKIASIVEGLKASSESRVEELVASLLTTFKIDREIVYLESELLWKSLSLQRPCATHGVGIETMLAREHQQDRLLTLAKKLAHTCGLPRHDDEDSSAEGRNASAVQMSPARARPFGPRFPCMMGLCAASVGWQPLRLSAIHEGRWAQVTYEDGKILVSAFTNQYCPADFVIPWRYLVNMLPARPMAFLEASVEGRCLGKIFVNVADSTRRVQQFLSLCLGTLGPSYTDTVLQQCSSIVSGHSEGYYVIGGYYAGSDEHWIELLTGNLEKSRGLCRRGVVATGDPGEGEVTWFIVCTGKCNGLPADGVVGETVTDLDTIEKAVLNSVRGHVVVSRCGLVIPTSPSSDP